MHAQIAAHAMAGAVVVIEPLFPERAARKGIELRAGRAFRKARQRERDVAFERVMSVVPSRYCAPESSR